jgi:hypothetical protein
MVHGNFNQKCNANSYAVRAVANQGTCIRSNAATSCFVKEASAGKGRFPTVNANTNTIIAKRLAG